jgi:cellulose synthase/poly-beta-1,6-N-acetylglucosamine synthase-like glycosyltransferase
VILRSYEGRIGKTACLNEAVPLAKGDIVVFSDANSRYDKNAINELVRHFQDDQIGFVTGTTKYVSGDGSNVLSPINLYSRLEILVKRLESSISSCIGADGAIFAIRKDLYKPLKDYDINDLVIPLNIIKKGFRGILEEKAFCEEEAPKAVKGDFDRQTRITTRTIRAIFNNVDVLNPFAFGLFSYELFSHKIAKFLVPLFMIILGITNLFMITHGSVYVLVFAGQLVFYLLACLGHLRRDIKVLSNVISMSKTFSITNLAILFGWIKFLRGDTFTTWSTVRSS